MKHTARLLRMMDDCLNGQERLYELCPPLEGHAHVVVGTFDIMQGKGTFIAAANANGRKLSWSNLYPNLDDVLSHEQALENVGYAIGEVGEAKPLPFWRRVWSAIQEAERGGH